MDYVSTYFVVSIADAKRYLGLDVEKTDLDDLLGHGIEAITDFFEQYTGRRIVSRALTEYYDGIGSDSVTLLSFPVTSTESTIDVRVDANGVFGTDTKLASTSLIVDQEAGIVYYRNSEFAEGRRNVKIAYTAGWATASVPKHIRWAAYTLLGDLWRRRANRAFNTSSVTGAGGGSVNFNIEALPAFTKAVLDGLRAGRV